jgi:hypothetical protein
MSKTTVALTTVIAQSPELVSTNIEGQTALLSIHNGAYYGMDRVGSRVWALIEQPRAVSAVVDQLLKEFAVERPTCEQHVLTFLQKLADADLLVVQ